MGERTTGTLPEDNRQTGTLASDRQTGTLPIDRQTGTLPIDNQSNRMTSTLQDDINSNKNYYNNDEDQYIYDLEICYFTQQEQRQAMQHNRLSKSGRSL